MDYYLDRIRVALEFVEANLGEKLPLRAIAKRAGYSPYHFHRIFSSLTGETPGEYVRRRRLGEAAKRLVETDERIVNLAFDAGFDSQEAFTRAFRREFGTTPGRFREAGSLPAYARVAPLIPETLSHLAKGVTMDPKVVRLEPFHVAGLSGRFTPSTTEGIASLWDRFCTKTGEITGIVEGKSYGVCFDSEVPLPSDDAEFEYMAAVGVESLDGLPEGVTGRTVPGGTYAVFTHRGPVRQIGETHKYIWGTWFPKSGYRPAGTPDFEAYDERFDPETGAGEVDIYIPVAESTE